jgi:hypothetical protein
VRRPYAARQPERCGDEPEECAEREGDPQRVIPRRIDGDEHRCSNRAIDPRASIAQPAETGPFETGADDEERDQTGEPRRRQEEQRREESDQ